MTGHRIKFIGPELPDPVRPKSKQRTNDIIVAALRKHPGQWAEIDIYPLTKRAAAGSKAYHLAHTHKGVQAATRVIDAKVFIYARWVDVDATGDN